MFAIFHQGGEIIKVWILQLIICQQFWSSAVKKLYTKKHQYGIFQYSFFWSINTIISGQCVLD